MSVEKPKPSVIAEENIAVEKSAQPTPPAETAEITEEQKQIQEVRNATRTDVLYQKLGDHWYAICAIGGDGYFTRVSDEAIEAIRTRGSSGDIKLETMPTSTRSNIFGRGGQS